MTSLRIRPDLAAIPDYVPGKTVAAIAEDETPPTEIFKASSNENPFAPLPSVQKVVENAASTMNLYPGTPTSGIAERVADRFNVDPATLVFGSGSAEIISQLIRATSGEGAEVIFAWRSFEAYPLLVMAAGATCVKVPLTADLAHDFDAMADAITDKTTLILVCNPNNPTGTAVSEEALHNFLRRVPKSVCVVIDEAYFQFNTRADSPVGIDFFHRHPNVAVAHTFSKAYGLAGLRIGYGIAPLELAAAMRKVSLPFGVTTLAQNAAVASLEAQIELDARVDAIVSERTRIVDILISQGWALPEPQGNFIWFPVGDDTTPATAYLEARGILVRPFPGEGFRYTIGSARTNDLFVNLASKLAEDGLSGGTFNAQSTRVTPM